jgi:hypothetical protein
MPSTATMASTLCALRRAAATATASSSSSSSSTTRLRHHRLVRSSSSSTRRRRRRLVAVASSSSSSDASFEDALRAAANRAIDAHVESGDRVGIGHGAMTSMALDRIHERLNDEVRSLSHWSPYDRVGVVNADP